MLTWEKVKKKYPVCFTTEPLPLDVMVMNKFSVIGASFGDSIQPGRGRGGRGTLTSK